jgi:hypothetical protein
MAVMKFSELLRDKNAVTPHDAVILYTEAFSPEGLEFVQDFGRPASSQVSQQLSECRVRARRCCYLSGCHGKTLKLSKVYRRSLSLAELLRGSRESVPMALSQAELKL